jgi:hypothetical protein
MHGESRRVYGEFQQLHGKLLTRTPEFAQLYAELEDLHGETRRQYSVRF